VLSTHALKVHAAHPHLIPGKASALQELMCIIMLQSHIIDINGSFVGAAVRLDKGYRFVALNLRVEELDGTIWPNLDTVRRLARQLFVSGHFGSAPTPPVALETLQ
jgi:hypothetical protein